ncbi:MAG: deoxyribonuclease IV [Acidobacteriia bacterium]|nr:deoxyribonuclease IV [Terriglobia bacterium]
MSILGIHTSISGSIRNAVLSAEELGCDCFQMFSRNPRGWCAPALADSEARAFVDERVRTKMCPVVIHDCYLVNLAAENEEIWKKSIQVFRDELARAVMLGADFVVFHPGNPRSLGREKGIERTVAGLEEAARGLRLNGVTILVENTAGMGSALGSDFAEVAEIVRLARQRNLRMGCCLDTQHAFAAGYDIGDKKGLEGTVRYLEKTVGLEDIKVIHTNDSKVPLGGRVDRHEQIGRGKIGREAFKRLVHHPGLRHLPFILETPIDEPGDDLRNLAVMRKLMDGPKVRGKRARRI